MILSSSPSSLIVYYFNKQMHLSILMFSFTCCIVNELLLLQKYHICIVPFLKSNFFIQERMPYPTTSNTSTSTTTCNTNLNCCCCCCILFCVRMSFLPNEVLNKWVYSFINYFSNNSFYVFYMYILDFCYCNINNFTLIYVLYKI